jgi:NADH-quinone oxidoreductase subunit F
MRWEDIDGVIDSSGSDRADLISVLQKIQDDYNYIPVEAVSVVAKRIGVSEAEVSGVVTFYSQFRLRPAGTHIIKVCIGTACHVKGAELTYEAFKRELGIAEDQDTDAQGIFTVEKVACLGCCMLAVAVQVDESIYAHVTPSNVRVVIDDILAGDEHKRGVLAGVAGQGAVVRLCTCSSCAAAGADEVLNSLRQAIGTRSLPVIVREVGCTGGAYHAPLMEIVTEDGHCFRYGRVKARDVESILLQHVKSVRPLVRLGVRLRAAAEYLFAGENSEPPLRFPLSVIDQPDARYWLNQRRVVTEGAGELPPLELDHYRAHGGFTAYSRALKMRPDEISGIIVSAGLRGRGGGGFPTGRKWRVVAGCVAERGENALVVCNGDEGDPGAFMDRMLLESYPFRVIEGMMIAALAVGASEGYFYIRHEYPLAVRRVREAIEILKKAGLIANISGGDFPVRVIEGAGAFVCGEETALLASIEGRRGVPRIRPPYPAQEGLFGRPTLVNNVETLASVPWIVREGVAAFRKSGSDRSPGTKAFALAGKILRSGLIEVPMGMSLRQVVDEIGGGVPEGGTLKAIQVGGPSGGCVPTELCDIPVDYEELSRVGSMMGSGGMVVLDQSDCMVDIARYFLAFTQLESCGNCTGCRIGIRRMLDILERLCNGGGCAGDIEKLEELAYNVRNGSICGLGKTAPNPVLSTIKYFRDEYQAHIERRCPAHKCRALIRYFVDESCIGCTLCAQGCPVEAIEFTPLERAVIDVEKCAECDICRQLCPCGAIRIVDRYAETDS